MAGDWLTAIEQWPVAAALRGSFYIYPLVNAAHIVGIAILVGAIVPLDLRILGAYRSVPLDLLARILIPSAATGAAIAVVAGMLLFTVKPHEYLANAAFITKLGLVTLGGANLVVVHATPAWRRARAGNPVAPLLRANAVASIVIWLAAILAGRWIGFL